MELNWVILESEDKLTVSESKSEIESLFDYKSKDFPDLLTDDESIEIINIEKNNEVDENNNKEIYIENEDPDEIDQKELEADIILGQPLLKSKKDESNTKVNDNFLIKYCASLIFHIVPLIKPIGNANIWVMVASGVYMLLLAEYQNRTPDCIRVFLCFAVSLVRKVVILPSPAASQSQSN